MTADDLLRNRLDAPYLTARYGEAIRYTLNPPGRCRGDSGWDAGPPEDWCQMPAPCGTEALAATERPQGMPQPMATRIDRQSACHDMTPCTRTAPHWPQDARPRLASRRRLDRLASVRPLSFTAIELTS